ncbi:hypothetical protein [Rothia mucilaginosa]|uniref:hypothetical protein n=1 Tax=Rothia mucilaginosa TaxID=43675 RepID=UPI0028EA9BB5|nr:hypothetical protein [Rothia mucilaginosa]
MDQFFQILFAGLSAIGAIVSGFCAYKTWLHTIGSKEAEAKAEESRKAALDMRDAAERSAKAAEKRANQAEKSLEKMQQLVAEQQSQSQSQSEIAASLHRPILEFTHVINDQRHNDYSYYLRNNTGTPVIVLEVTNLNNFNHPGLSIPKLPIEVHPGNPVKFNIPHTRANKSLELRINVSGKEETIFVEIP